MLTSEDKKWIKEAVVEIVKDMVLPALQVMDEKMDKGLTELGEKIEVLDIKIDEVALNQKKDKKRIQTLEKAFTNS